MQRANYRMKLSDLKRLIAEEASKALNETEVGTLSSEEVKLNLRQNLDSLKELIDVISGPGSDALKDAKESLEKFVDDVKSKTKLSQDDIEKINNVFHMFSVAPVVASALTQRYKDGLEELAGEAGYLIKHLKRGSSVGSKRGGLLGKLLPGGSKAKIEVPAEHEIADDLRTSGQFASEKDLKSAAADIHHNLVLFSKTLPQMRDELAKELKSGLSNKFPSGLNPEVLAGNLLDVILLVDFEGGKGVPTLPDAGLTGKQKAFRASRGISSALKESKKKLNRRKLNEDLKMLNALLNKISAVTGGETIPLEDEDIEEIPMEKPGKLAQFLKDEPKSETEKSPSTPETLEQKYERLIQADSRSEEDKKFIKDTLLTWLFDNKILLKMVQPKNLKDKTDLVLSLKKDLGIK